MLQKLAEANLLAIVVAGVVSFFMGAIWYMPLFGKLWVRLHGWSEEQVKEAKAKMKPAIFFGGMIVSYLVVTLNLTEALHGVMPRTALPDVGIGVFEDPEGHVLGLVEARKTAAQ